MDPFIGQIQAYGFNFAPRGWAKCEGQLMPIATNSALFSLLGTTYGGDGKTTFGLPDLRGRAPMSAGRGPGLSDRKLGTKSGTETVNLITQQMPAHNHTASVTLSGRVRCTENNADSVSPVNNTMGRIGDRNIYSDNRPEAEMEADTVTVSGNIQTDDTGGSQGHNNMQPYLVINYCIALVGIYPSRS